MKLFIKNSYLFLIFFILLLSKDFIMGLFNYVPKIEYESLYVKKLEDEIKNINVIKGNNVFNSFSYGKIVYKNPYSKYEMVTMLIDSDSIARNDLVINNMGLVGVVDKVYKNYALVKLVNSSDIVMQVKINDCYGVLRYDKYFYVDNVDSLCNVVKNDNIYTSDLGYFSEKVNIGKVNNINIFKNGKKIYQIKFDVNFNNLNYVIILSRDNYVDFS